MTESPMTEVLLQKFYTADGIKERFISQWILLLFINDMD